MAVGVEGVAVFVNDCHIVLLVSGLLSGRFPNTQPIARSVPKIREQRFWLQKEDVVEDRFAVHTKTYTQIHFRMQ